METQIQPNQSSKRVLADLCINFNLIFFFFFLPCQVSKGLYRLLIGLCILRHIQSPDGLVWKCKPSHLYLIEYLAKRKGVRSTRKQEVCWGSA